MVEQRTHKPLVVGSNPTAATKIMKEIEARFLEIEPKAIAAKLKKLGVKKAFDKVFKEAIVQPPVGRGFEEWEKTRKRIRVRDSGGKVELTLKENVRWGLSETKEIEFEVPSFELAVEFLESCGLEVKRLQEKRRVSFQTKGVHIEIDYWPWIPPCLEIEGQSEELVKKWAQNLDLDWKSADFRDAKKVYLEDYSIDIDKIKEVSFTKPKPNG